MKRLDCGGARKWMIALLFAAVSLCAQANPTMPLRSAFIVRQAIEDVSLSPDGRRMAWIRTQGDLREVWKQDIASGKRTRLVSRTPATSLIWTSDSRWLVMESPRAVFAVDAAGSAPRVITALGGERKRAVLRVDTARNAVWVLDQRGHDASGKTGLWRVSRIDFHGREAVVLSSRLRVVSLVTDARGALLWIQRVRGEALTLEQMVAGRPREVLRCEALRKCSMLSAASDGGLWMRSDLDEDLTSLQKLSPAGNVQTVHSDPRGIADVAKVLLDPASLQPLATQYRSDLAFNRFIAPSNEMLNTNLQRALAGYSLDVETSADGRTWLVKASKSDSPALQWYLFNTATRTLSPVLAGQLLDARTHKPVAPVSGNASTRAVTWRASDGMTLHGFITVPSDVDPATAPVVVNVHGGPWNHFRPEYRAVAQFLASRGYIVFEPNFRASTGFGRHYVLAAHGDFGNGRVQADIVEGVRWMLAQGFGDPRRVGITGASFGGYATLQALTHQTDLFKVGVAMVPPPDFGWTLKWTLRNPEALEIGNVVPMEAWLRTLQIDTTAPGWDIKLRAQSPMANVTKMSRPLLIFAGARDARVGLAGVIEYAARLKLAGQDITLVVDSDAGHSNEDPVAREAYLFALERMFGRYLGGRQSHPPDAKVKDFFGQAIRCAGKDWLAFKHSRASV